MSVGDFLESLSQSSNLSRGGLSREIRRVSLAAQVQAAAHGALAMKPKDLASAVQVAARAKIRDKCLLYNTWHYIAVYYHVASFDIANGYLTRQPYRRETWPTADKYRAKTVSWRECPTAWRVRPSTASRYRWNRNHRPQPQKFNKVMFLI